MGLTNLTLVPRRYRSFMAASLLTLMVGTPLFAQSTFIVPLSGAPNDRVPGFVPHGDPLVSGYAELTITGNQMDYHIVLEGARYAVTQAHLYNINKTSGTSGNALYGDSIICWGGRWANGGDSDDFLSGTGYYNSRLSEVLADPTSWYLMLHTEGGHFANDTEGKLIPYDPNRSGPQETSVTGVRESERNARFNNRVGKTLLDMVLRVDNPRVASAPYYNPSNPANWNSTPFPDSSGNMWVEPDGNGGWQLTTAAIANGYDLTTRYLFYLYDDQGPDWDFGGPEGAFGGFLSNPISFNGDVDFDGEINVNDWLQLLDGYGTDLTGLSAVERYRAGDIDLDGIHSLNDIQAFRNAYASAGGSLADLRMGMAVPEPSTLCCFCVTALLGVVGMSRGFRRDAAQ